MLNSRIIFNKVILFSVEAYLSKSIADGFSDEKLHKDIVSGINSYRMMGRFSRAEQDIVSIIGTDEFIRKVTDAEFSHVIYALELLRLWVTEVPRDARKHIYLGVGNKKIKGILGIFIMSMLRLKQHDKEAYATKKELITSSKIRAKQFFFYMDKKIKERVKDAEKTSQGAKSV